MCENFKLVSFVCYITFMANNSELRTIELRTIIVWIRITFEVHEEPMPRTKKILHHAVKFQAGEENRIVLKVCTDYLAAHRCWIYIDVLYIDTIHCATLFIDTPYITAHSVIGKLYYIYPNFLVINVSVSFNWSQFDLATKTKWLGHFTDCVSFQFFFSCVCKGIPHVMYEWVTFATTLRL